MGREISRRDFLQGAVGGVVGGAFGGLVAGTGSGAVRAQPTPSTVGHGGVPASASLHPPSRTGLRGSHAGSFEVAHQMALERRTDWGPAHEPDPGAYDLVVVGAGVSGLSAAFLYLEQNPGARVLLLENHDDFGGHARRNEFEWEGRTILGYGGSQSLEAPSAYSDTAMGLLSRIGVEPKRLAEAYDQDFYRRHGLASSIYFDAEHYGVDRVVKSDLVDASGFIPVAPAGQSIPASVAQMPISEAARRQLLALIEGGEDRLPDHSIFSEPGFLMGVTYQDLITKHLGVTEPEVVALLEDVPRGYLGHGIDVCPALFALLFGLPGLSSTSLRHFEGLIRRGVSWMTEPYVYHFPDGNASIARLLVRKLIPEVAPGQTMEDVVTAPFDYAKLDRADSPVRLRLGSTVVRVRHDGDPRSAERVDVTYVRDGRTEQVRGKHVVLACYNMAIPYLCPELPEDQRSALSQGVKIPFAYNTVLLRNWRAFEKLGVGVAHCPGSWHKFVMVDFPVSLGDVHFAKGPDDPVVVHMSRGVTRAGGTPQEQSRAGRYELLDKSFESFERDIRSHLAGMLGAGGFDPARDIAGITVNRWPHGYAFEANPIFDGEPEGEPLHVRGRRTFGRIAIANSDAGARAYLDEAIDQAARAVGELAG